ncbi:Protein kinase domain-containing protein OS=Streptomyces parvulus OX=146923 GN=Spa2297_34075 PE=4 SV=1 [Streptomyces parvulus]|nr:protein kinase [Streptomyces sp. SID5606]MZD52505.1 protein kinase [Streptomyces sp. SID5606]MZD58712.1 protein kinase [Streptomyces sp. SID5606]
MKDFGHVHVVKHEDGREGVLKLARPNRQGKVSATTRQRFQEEVRRMQQLTADGVTGIVPVLDADPDDPPQWFVMPKAVKLTDVLRQHGQPADLREVVEAVHQVAGTLAVLAERDISHRDIKPDNLLHFQGRAVVADFGIAAWPDRPELTAATAKMGPLYFLAPEMRFPEPGTPGYPADVWSLAKVLFVLAKGLRYPPEGTHYTQGQEYSLWAQGGEAAMDLAPVLEKATAYEPRDRLPMATFRDELAAWLELHPGPVAPAHPAFRQGFRALEAATFDVRRHEAELRRLLPGQLRRLARAQHGQTDQWFPSALGERHPENVRLIDLHGYPDDPDYDMGVDGMALSSTVPDAAGRRIVLGGFLMGTTTTLAAEIQQAGKVLGSWTEDVNVLLPSALVALRRITGEVETAFAQLA